MKKKKHMTEEVAGKLEDGVTEPETVSVKESESVSAEQPEAAETEEELEKKAQEEAEEIAAYDEEGNPILKKKKKRGRKKKKGKTEKPEDVNIVKALLSLIIYIGSVVLIC